MKTMLVIFSMIVLRCCWGPTEYQLMQSLQNDDTILKILNGTYKITELNQEDVSVFKLNITFDYTQKKVSGFSGCNRFFGSYILNENSLKFDALGTTKKLCSEDKNEIERKLLKVFDKADSVLFVENGFSLFCKKRSLLLATKDIKAPQMSFEYSTSSRSAYKYIKVDENTISLSKKRGGKSLEIPSNVAQWETLVELSNAIEIENLSDIKAPSKKFLFDGAALAHFRITSNGTTYESSPFDHGNPPKEIARLVKEILSIVENIE